MNKMINSEFRITELVTTAGNYDRPAPGQAYQTVRLELLDQPNYSIVIEFMMIKGNLPKPYFVEDESTLMVYFPLEMYDMVFKSLLAKGAKAQYAFGSIFVISSEYEYTN